MENGERAYMKFQLKEVEYKGKLITFCGLDGCGKTSMIIMLDEYMKNNNIAPILTKQPTDKIRCSAIFRNFMDSNDNTEFDYRALSLFAAADRIQHTNKFILPKLQEGNIVISDRYIFSCLANLKARGYETDLWIYEIATHIVKPDLAFFLDVEVELALKRVKCRKDEKDKYVNIDLQYKLREQYTHISKEIGGITIPSSGSPAECFEKILFYIDKMKILNTLKD